ncbi:hypothetical protein MTR67_006576 [Solanum verrucosum]|uniref:Uncharacterized protein n=1 Tax=Solanum verrucosum TaxID=315347 RepID=A0AAF0TBZ0_SOLVR|nr:hypothetical protein MTR67_006576 [Solanum verrucosum]
MWERGITRNIRSLWFQYHIWNIHYFKNC